MSLNQFKSVINQKYNKDLDFLNSTIKDINIEKDSKILDIGTKYEIICNLLALNGFDVIRIQLKDDTNKHFKHPHPNFGISNINNQVTDETEFKNKDSLILWKKSAEELGFQSKIKIKDVKSNYLPFSNDEFDIIFLYDTLQNINEREIILNECIRILNTQGILCIIEWNESSIKDEEDKKGIVLDNIDPVDYLHRDDILLELKKGKYVNFYIIRKYYKNITLDKENGANI